MTIFNDINSYYNLKFYTR